MGGPFVALGRGYQSAVVQPVQPYSGMALREFEDQAGRRWAVWETFPGTTAGLSPEYHDGWLTFDDGTERRRLRPVPPNWEALPLERLTMLLRVADGAPTARDTPLAQIEEERRVSERRESERRQAERRVRNRRRTTEPQSPSDGGAAPLG